MGTKKEPGAYDCYAKLEEDEPYFLLRGKDPVGPYLVKIWAASRQGKLNVIEDLVRDMARDQDVVSRVSSDDHEKLQEARQCAANMESWRRQKEASRARRT